MVLFLLERCLDLSRTKSTSTALDLILSAVCVRLATSATEAFAAGGPVAIVDCSAILAERLKDPRVPGDEAARRALDLFSLLEVLWARLRFLPRPLPFGICRKIKPEGLLSEIFKTVN